MSYEIWLPANIYSHINGVEEKNIVESFEVVNNCIHVGNYYIPLSNVLFIKNLPE